MDFFDNVVSKSNAIIKDRLNNPFGAKPTATAAEPEASAQQRQEPPVNSDQSGATPCLESTARQHLMGSRDSGGSNGENSQGDRNSQFAAMAADAEAVAQKAAKGAKNIGTFLFSMANKAGQTVSQTAKQVKQAVESTNILTDLTREQQEFVKQMGGSLQPGELPWDGCADESRSAYIREQILTLSQDKRNFVRSPPNDSEFKFDSHSCYPQALSLIREDPNLFKLRQELVPKLVNEETFWCNYFYRVSMLLQMSERGERSKQGWASSRSSSGEGPDEVGDNITPHGTIDEPPSPGYSSASNATNTTYTGSAATDRQQQFKQESFNLDKQVASSQSLVGQPLEAKAEAVTSPSSGGGQSQIHDYQPSELESSESRKLFAEADDLKSRLRELNIGSLDNNDEGEEDDDKWEEEELQRDLLEFELISGEDVDAYDEETLQKEIAQLDLATERQ